MTGVEITVDLMKKIQDSVPRLTGLKHSSLHFRNVAEFKHLGLSCFIGSCALMLPALTVGAVGCVDGPPIMAPEVWVEIWKAYQSGDLDAAEKAQSRTRDIVALAVESGRFFANLKTVLSHRLGIDCGLPRPPALGLTDDQRRHVIARAEELGLGPVDVAP